MTILQYRRRPRGSDQARIMLTCTAAGLTLPKKCYDEAGKTLSLIALIKRLPELREAAHLAFDLADGKISVTPSVQTRAGRALRALAKATAPDGK